MEEDFYIIVFYQYFISAYFFIFLVFLKAKVTMSKSSLWDRIALVLNGESERSFCARANLKKTSLESVKRSQNPTMETLLAISKAAAVSIDWLATGKGPMHPDDRSLQSSSNSVEVPHYDVALSAGAGAFNDAEAIKDYISFPIEMIEKKLHVKDPSNLAIVEVKGDSMEPTIDEGSLVMIDQSRHDITDGLVALVYNGDAYIKRIQKDLGDVHIISDNPAYSKKTLSGRDCDNLKIIGKIIWSDKRYD